MTLRGKAVRRERSGEGSSTEQWGEERSSTEHYIHVQAVDSSNSSNQTVFAAKLGM